MGFSRLKRWVKAKTTPLIERAAKNVYIGQGWTDEDGRWTEKGRKRHSPPHDQEKAW